jgi:LPXTG-motif cell wall-anchored protein
MRRQPFGRLPALRNGRVVAALAVLAATLLVSPILATPAQAAVVPVVNVTDATVVEGNAGFASLQFHVILDQPTTDTVSLSVDTADGTATVADNDYQAQSLTVTYLPGATDATITVPVVGDTTFEPDETLTLIATKLTNATAGDVSGLGTITNDDVAPVVPVVNVTDATVVEGDAGFASLQFHVILDQPTTLTVSMNVATADGTATIADNDYQAQNLTVTYLPGATDATVIVPAVGDTTFEPDETLTLVASNLTNAAAGDLSGLGTITNDDLPSIAPAVNVSDATVVEGDAGLASLQFHVILDQPTALTVSMNVATADGTATVADNDYQAQNLTLTYLPGATDATINVPVVGDTNPEPDEALTLNVSNFTNASAGDASGAGEIVDDDTLPVITVSDATVVEGNASTHNLAFQVSLDHPFPKTVSVQATTADGTATTADSDYQPVSVPVVFAPGATTATVDVPVVGDLASESDEALTLNLATPVNGNVGDGTGAGTIRNDDASVNWSAPSASTTEGSSGTTGLVLTATLTNAVDFDVDVPVSLTDGTARKGSDYTDVAPGTMLHFAAGSTSASVTVPIVGDTTDEPDEMFTAQFSVAAQAPGSATAGVVAGSVITLAVTIVDDDPTTATTIPTTATPTVASTGTLPVTGADIADTVVVGGALFFGGALVLGTRRRRASTIRR